jgi:hypothetical protein
MIPGALPPAEGPAEAHSFDVMTSPHDDVKEGRLVRVWSRVLISAEAYPSTTEAAEVAATLAVAVHGGMPTSVLLRI